MRVMEKVYRWSSWVAGGVAGVLSVMITADVLKRWLMGRPFLGVLELAQVAFLIITFLALGQMEHSGSELRIDILSSRLKGKAESVLKAFTCLVGMVFWGLFLWRGLDELIRAFQLHSSTPGMIEVPTVYHEVFMIFGGLLVLISLLTLIARILVGLATGKGDSSAKAAGGVL